MDEREEMSAGIEAGREGDGQRDGGRGCVRERVSVK